jgi:predicted nuclease of predicted toxin-antitoxin system
LLVDQNLSARVAELLGDVGHGVGHTASLGLEVADDEVVLGQGPRRRPGPDLG